MSATTPLSTALPSPLPSPLPPPLPPNAECRCLLPDGRLLTITASRRARAGRADVKCMVPGAPAVAERMQEVVRLARHTEARFDSRDQVVLSMDIAPPAQQRDWELAAVLADRLVRGVLPARAIATAQGWSDAWHLGQVAGPGAASATTAALRQRLADAGAPATAPLLLGDDGQSGGQNNGRNGSQNGNLKSRRPDDANANANANANGADGADDLCLSHLGALHGHADPSAAVSTVRTWFPLHSGGVNDCLGWVEVSVHPVDGAVDAAADGADQRIAAPGLDPAAQLAVRQALAGARHFDGRGTSGWRTVVRFGQPRFHGESYQLALVMADRLARGREFVPRGRIIASGRSSAWHAGRVETVDGREPKLALILKQAGAGDRVLLPRDWQAALPDGFAAALKARGASLACIDRIGII